MNALDAALDYAKFGWQVFPCKANDKLPLTEHGFKDATNDNVLIKSWFEKWPDANLAVATGERSRLFAVDVDVKNDAPGMKSLAELETKYGPLPKTVTSKTWSGGKHLLFDYPSRAIRNRAGVLPGIDVRGDGGYIVVPPSQIQGRAYEWESEGEIAVPPGWLVDLIAGDTQNTGKPSSNVDWDALRKGVGQGRRNDQLFRFACSLRRHSIPLEEAKVQVLEKAALCQPPLPPQEALKIVEGVYARYPEGPLHLTDTGNAFRLVQQHGEDLRYVYGLGNWIVWQGHYWREDKEEEVIRRAKATANLIPAEIPEAPDDAKKKEIFNWARQSERRERLNAAVVLARCELDVIESIEKLDANHFLLGVRNGVVDLRTGEFRAGRREDNITKQANCAFDPNVKCPTWEGFLLRVMNGRQALVDYLQRALGYSMTGDTREDALFILYGTGENGKSTFIGVVEKLLGDYAMHTQPETWMVRDRGSSPIRNDLAALRGARFVSTVEPEDGQRLSESLIKQATGRDAIQCRFLNKEFFTYYPQWKLWMGTNYRPVIRGTDEGIWRRPRLVPFDVQIPKGEQDKELPDKLQAEASGILNWLIAGCLAWQKQGLADPDEVREATQAYRNEMDFFGQFVKEKFEVGKTFWANYGQSYAAYKKWCEANGYKSLSSSKFDKEMERRGYEKEKRNRLVWFRGIKLAEEDRA